VTLPWFGAGDKVGNALAADPTLSPAPNQGKVTALYHAIFIPKKYEWSKRDKDRNIRW
jgi:hypothetical protein